MKKVLLAGPWVGELGWELFCWQGHIRKIAHQYDKVIVFCKTGHEVLYSDFTDSFITFDIPVHLSSDMWMCEGVSIQKMIDEVKELYTDKLLPFNTGISITNGNITVMKDMPFLNQKFIRYRSDSLDQKFDLIFHPRNKRVGDDRNWGRDKWQQLVDALKQRFSIAVIGNHESFELDGTRSFRNIPLEQTISLMNRCRLVVGQSSGPIHLAALAGARHLVWSDEKNRNRFEKIWNPLKTKCIFFSEKRYDPTVGDIYGFIESEMTKQKSIWSKLI